MPDPIGLEMGMKSFSLMLQSEMPPNGPVPDISLRINENSPWFQVQSITDPDHKMIGITNQGNGQQDIISGTQAFIYGDFDPTSPNYGELYFRKAEGVLEKGVNGDLVFRSNKPDPIIRFESQDRQLGPVGLVYLPEVNPETINIARKINITFPDGKLTKTLSPLEIRYPNAVYEGSSTPTNNELSPWVKDALTLQPEAPPDTPAMEALHIRRFTESAYNSLNNSPMPKGMRFDVTYSETDKRFTVVLFVGDKGHKKFFADLPMPTISTEPPEKEIIGSGRGFQRLYLQPEKPGEDVATAEKVKGSISERAYQSDDIHNAKEEIIIENAQVTRVPLVKSNGKPHWRITMSDISPDSLIKVLNKLSAKRNR